MVHQSSGGFPSWMATSAPQPGHHRTTQTESSLLAMEPGTVGLVPLVPRAVALRAVRVEWLVGPGMGELAHWHRLRGRLGCWLRVWIRCRIVEDETATTA